MNRLKLLVASSVIAAISGCSFSVAHRGHDGCGETAFAEDGCGEPAHLNSHSKCAKCGKRPKRRIRTAPLFAGDSYGQFANSMECGCGEPFMGGMSGTTYPSYGTEIYVDAVPGCSTCSGGMSADMMSTGGCGSQGGAINPQYLVPQNAAPALTPAPAPAPPAYRGGEPAQAPPATEDSRAEPMPAPMDPPMNDSVPAPFDDLKSDEFGADPAGAPAADTPADPVSWQVPVSMR